MENTNTAATSPTATSAAATAPKIVRRGEGLDLFAFGQGVRVQLSAAETGGLLDIACVEVPAQNGPPYHIHHREDEFFIVREGRFGFTVDGERVEVGPGDVVYGPRDVPHTFLNIGDETAYLQVVAVNSGFAAFFAESAASQAAGEGMDRAVEIFHKHGLEFAAPDLAPVRQSKGGARPKVINASANANFNDAFWLQEAETAGAFSCHSVRLPAGSALPSHIHENEDELYLIESGAFEFEVDGERHQLAAGDLLWAPRGIAHGFRVLGDEAAAMISFATPGGPHDFHLSSVDALLTGNFADTTMVQHLKPIGADYGIRFSVGA